MTKDLHHSGDGLALNIYPELSETLKHGALGIEGDKQSDIVIISYGNGMHLSRQAAYVLKSIHQTSVKLIDLRWLAPLNINNLADELKGKSKILIVDECRNTGSLSEQIMAWMVDDFTVLPKIKRLTAADSFIPLGQAWEHLLPSVESIVESVLTLKEDN
jgi:2-oxoisovalerate dehydrogenase E1 component